VLIESGDESSAEMVLKNFEAMPLSQNKFDLLQSLIAFLGKTNNMEVFKKGIDDIAAFRDAIPGSFQDQTNPYINGILLKGLATKKKDAGLTEQYNYILSKLPAEDKKGF
jgi:aminopeptidase N